MYGYKGLFKAIAQVRKARKAAHGAQAAQSRPLCGFSYIQTERQGGSRTERERGGGRKEEEEGRRRKEEQVRYEKQNLTIVAFELYPHPE